mmetsp:Transcript_25982/g.72544  ORF Transcript_25982/g.72544 Transcript_25982/m.72544 type:complete len:236 (-) Transcript_25982:109-816(-)
MPPAPCSELPLGFSWKPTARPRPSTESLGVCERHLGDRMRHGRGYARVGSVRVAPIGSLHRQPPRSIRHLRSDRRIHLFANEGFHSEGPTEALGFGDVAGLVHEPLEPAVAHLKLAETKRAHCLLMRRPLRVHRMHAGVRLVSRNEPHGEGASLEVNDAGCFLRLATADPELRLPCRGHGCPGVEVAPLQRAATARTMLFLGAHAARRAVLACLASRQLLRRSAPEDGRRARAKG